MLSGDRLYHFTKLLIQITILAPQQAKAIAPAQLLEVMTQAFSVARDALIEVDAAWTNLEFILKDAESQILLGTSK